MRNVVQQSFVVFTIGEKSYTVVYQKYKKNVVSTFQVKFQFKIRQKFRSKWNDIGHTFEFRNRREGIKYSNFTNCC